MDKIDLGGMSVTFFGREASDRFTNYDLITDSVAYIVTEEWFCINTAANYLDTMWIFYTSTDVFFL